jgi:aryl-alcohol dehydrogenase-like predicted oxidoreductase
VKLALGTAQFGLHYGIANRAGQISRAEGAALLSAARSARMDTLDTAIAYGSSEERLGEIGLDGWRVVSKLPPVPEGCDDVDGWVTQAVRGSLARLKAERLYGLLLHRPQQLLETTGEQLYRAMNRLKSDGLVEKIGISIYAPIELEPLCGRFDLDMVQAPFSILDRRLVDTGWLDRLAGEGIEVHARSIFLQGLLLMEAGQRPQKFARWREVWLAWHEWLREAGLTPLQACLRHALGFEAISRVIVGVDSVRQLDEILQAAQGPAPQMPDAVRTDDVDLLNPSRWLQPA